MEPGILAYSMRIGDDSNPTRIVLRLDLSEENSESCQALFEALRCRAIGLREQDPNKYNEYTFGAISVALLAGDMWTSIRCGERDKLYDLAVMVLSIMDCNYGILYYNSDGQSYFEQMDAETEESAIDKINECFSDTSEDLLVG